MQSVDSAVPPAPDSLNIQTKGLVLGEGAARILMTAALTLGGGILVLLALTAERSLLLGSNQPTYAFLAVALVCAWLTHRKHTRLATQFFMWSLLAVMIANAVLVQGIRTPGLLVSLPMLVLLSGWLTGLRNALVFGTLGVACVLALWGAEAAGWLQFTTSRPAQNYAVVLIMGILTTMAVTYGSLKGFLAQMRQITSLSETLRLRIADLERSEARFVALFRGTPLPCVTVDESGVIVDVNEAWLGHFGYTRAQVVGLTARELDFWVVPAQREIFYANYRAGRRTPFAAQLQSPARPSTPYLLYTSEVQYENERRFVFSLLDQSDRVAAEHAQRQTQEQLERRVDERTHALQQTVLQLTQARETLVRSEKLASLGALVAGVSHELNTPLGNSLTVATSIQHSTHQMRTAVEANQIKRSALLEFFRELDEMAEVVGRNTQRAADLVSSFKQVAVDRTSERRREFSLQGLVEDILAFMRPGMKHLQLGIHNAVPSSIVCNSYPGAVGQIVSNLLQNCAVHAFDGRTGGCIDIRAREDGEWVELEVQDNGAGMPPEVLSHVFDPFFTTRLGKGGSGLGLSVSHSLAASVLCGELRAASHAGQGSCFTLRFMRTAPPQADSNA